MRSESVRGVFSGGVGEEGEVGVVVVEGRRDQNWALLRRELYFVCWSGVKEAGDVVLEVWVGWMKGVLTGLIEPSTVGFAGMVGESVVGGVEDVKAIGGTGDVEGFAGSDMWPLVVSSFSVLRPFMAGACVVISDSLSCCIGSRMDMWAQLAC